MRRNLLRALVLPAISAVGACAPAPHTLRPVLDAAALATQRLAVVQAQDASMLRSATLALIDTRRITLRGQVHRSLLQRGYLTPLLEPDAAALDADLAEPNAGGPLVRDIRAGRMTRDQAVAWLSDYALALRMTDGDPVRATLLARLSLIHDFEADAAALIEALDARSAHTRALLTDLDASGEALAHYAAFAPSPSAPATESLRAALATLLGAAIRDPERRAAALELLDSILTPPPAAAPLVLVPTE